MPQTFIDVRIPKENKEKQKALVKHLIDKLRKSLESRSSQVEEKMLRWENNYMGKPRQDIRTTPFYNASNFVSGMIRMHTDIYHARIMGFIFGVKPFWQPSWFTSSIKHEWLMACADWMEYTCWNRMQFFEPIDTAFHSVAKLGTTVLKAPWVEQELWKATQEQEGGSIGSAPQKFKTIMLSPIHYQDFCVYPLTSRSLETVLIKFHRLRYTEDEVRYRQATRGWDKTACDALLLSPTSPKGNAEISIANRSGIQLTPDVSRPYQVVECHLNYELEPGKLFPIVVLLNPLLEDEKAVLRMYYKTYNALDLDEFIDFHLNPKENIFWKDGIPQILEGHFEEHTQLHNNRRDASTMANVPVIVKKRFSEVGRPAEEWYPGKVFEVDSMDDIRFENGAQSYNHMVEEEHEIMGQADRLIGNPPPSQGFGSGSMGKRGVYNTQGTLALLGEGNRRLDLFLMRLRNPCNKLGRLIHESFKDFGDEQSFYQGTTGNDANIKAALSIRPPDGYGGVWFGLNASNASANRETERTSLLLMANTLASYYGQIIQVMQTVVQAPQGSPFQQLGLAILDGAKNMADRILHAFNLPDREGLIPDVRAVLGGQQPPNGPASPGAERVPPPEGNVSSSNLQSLSSAVGQIARAGGAGGPRPQ